MSVIETGNYDHLGADDIKKIQDAAKEAAKSKLRAESERDLQKEIATGIKEQFGIKTGDFNDLVTRYHKQDRDAVTAKRENQNALFDTVFPDGSEPENEDE